MNILDLFRFKTLFQRFPFIGGLLAQVISLILLRNILILLNFQLSSLLFFIFQGTLAAIISIKFFKLPNWFLYISYLLPALFFIDSHLLHFSTAIYGILFIIFALTFSHTLKERVPLYLTNETTFNALKEIANKRKAKSFVDLGSGLGGVVRALSSEELKSFGVETAPLPWLISSFLSFKKGKILRQNIWETDLSQYDIIYAFLSPAIMSKLYQKIQNEMRPDAIFISNSFEVVGEKTNQMIELNDGRKTTLFLYTKKN